MLLAFHSILTIHVDYKITNYIICVYIHHFNPKMKPHVHYVYKHNINLEIQTRVY